jgi:hypothetical protein
MKTRTDLLNHLAEKYNLQRYLEIGVQVPQLNFDKIKCPYKVGVDPDPAAHASFCMTSDEFFDALPIEREQLDVTCVGDILPMHIAGKIIPFDLVFIDGFHTAEQSKKDFENALKILSPNGFIVLHDCNPLKEEHTIVPRPTKTGHWNGDVYRFAVGLSDFYDEDQYSKKHITDYHTVDIDNGCLVFRNTDIGNYSFEVSKISWEYFHKNRKELLNLISWDEFIVIGSHV